MLKGNSRLSEGPWTFLFFSFFSKNIKKTLNECIKIFSCKNKFKSNKLSDEILLIFPPINSRCWDAVADIHK